MKLHYKTLLLLLLFPALVFSNNGKLKGKYTKEKSIKKEFSVNATAGLQVSNAYGNIDIVTWNENRTVIDVSIVTNGDNEEKVKQKLDEITVEFSATGSLVTAKTLFKDRKNSWSLWGNNSNNVHMEINYTIKIPITNSVDLNNDYGAISLNRLKGNAKINCDYGQLIIGELLADNNYLNFDYTNKSTIEFMKSGKINADYSEFTLNKVEKLELIADYTQSEVKEVDDINYNCDYGKVTIGKARTIIGRGDYVTNNIGNASGSINLNTDYGSIQVDRLTSGTKNIIISADYTRVKLGFDSNVNFNFVVDLSYASLKGEDYVTITKSSINNNSKVYSGYFGKQNSGNNVSINSNYGGVTFIKN
jgi:hypothetical protein